MEMYSLAILKIHSMTENKLSEYWLFNNKIYMVYNNVLNMQQYPCSNISLFVVII